MTSVIRKTPAFVAISDRFLAVMPAACALPPMRPSATAAAFLPSSVVMSSISSVAIRVPPADQAIAACGGNYARLSVRDLGQRIP